jgi:transcriptional regulator with XRE-family HTH domain
MENDMSLEDNFRRSVRKRRKELGLTQGDLARMIEVAPARVTQIETASDSSPTLKQVQRIAKALDCDPLVLLVQSEYANSLS